jgi:quinol monooxygenase YgiN
MSTQSDTLAGCAVVELRRYALHPNAREALIELFDRELVETQEAVGMMVLGQFRDLDDPDAFVWLRGFSDMPTRGRALQAFYGGPVWERHADAANATMVDSDNVLLLRPVTVSAGLELDGDRRPPPGAETVAAGVFAVTICSLSSAAAEFPSFYRREVEPALRDSGADVVASFATEHAANNFPRLPVREGEEVFVWISRFPDEAAHSSHAARLDLAGALADRIDTPPETWRLTPTSRSMMRG